MFIGDRVGIESVLLVCRFLSSFLHLRLLLCREGSDSAIA